MKKTTISLKHPTPLWLRKVVRAATWLSGAIAGAATLGEFEKIGISTDTQFLILKYASMAAAGLSGFARLVGMKPSEGNKEPTIILLDNDKLTTHALRDCFDDRGLAVRTYNDYNLLLGSFHERVDILIIDHFLNGKTGLQIMERMQARYPGVRVIALTAADDRHIPIEYYDRGAVKVITKDPGYENELINCILEVKNDI